MSFFKKLKDRMFKSSSRLDEGLAASISAPPRVGEEEELVVLPSSL